MQVRFLDGGARSGSRSRWTVAALILGVAASGCSDDGVGPYSENERPGRLFFDDFQGEPRQWTPFVGEWGVASTGTRQYAVDKRTTNQTVAGSARWTDYRVQVNVTIHDDTGFVGLMGRVAGTHHYYELLLGR